MRNQYIPADLGAQMSPAMGNLRKFACKWAGCSTGFSSLEGLQQHMQAHVYETAYVEERNQSYQYGYGMQSPATERHAYPTAHAVNSNPSPRVLTPPGTNPLDILGHVASMHREYSLRTPSNESQCCSPGGQAASKPLAIPGGARSAAERVVEVQWAISAHTPPAHPVDPAADSPWETPGAAARASSAPAAEKGLHYFMSSMHNVAPGPLRKGDYAAAPRRDGHVAPRGPQNQYNRSPYLGASRHDYVTAHHYASASSASSYTAQAAYQIAKTARGERLVNASKSKTKRPAPVDSDGLGNGENGLFDFCVNLSAMPSQVALSPLH